MADDPEILSVSTTTHGRVLVRRTTQPVGFLVGFHGYFENAAAQLARLDAIPGAERWTRVSVQALHRVYKGRTPEVVASWMTIEDRDEAIADNIAYVRSVMQAVAGDTELPTLYAGFSQGVAMAFRAAVHGGGAGVIAVGGDVPPELLEDAASRFPPVFLARGAGDDWYSPEKHEADAAALRARGVRLDVLAYEAGHHWNAAVSEAAARWMARLTAPQA